jgi:hypothetical protein
VALQAIDSFIGWVVDGAVDRYTAQHCRRAVGCNCYRRIFSRPLREALNSLPDRMPSPAVSHRWPIQE